MKFVEFNLVLGLTVHINPKWIEEIVVLSPNVTQIHFVGRGDVTVNASISKVLEALKDE